MAAVQVESASIGAELCGLMAYPPFITALPASLQLSDIHTNHLSVGEGQTQEAKRILLTLSFLICGEIAYF